MSELENRVRKACDKAVASAWEAYEEAVASAREAYKENHDPGLVGRGLGQRGQESP